MAKKRGGGPKTTEGKRNSSRNSTTHGCRSKTVVILKDEEQEDYDEMEREWNDEFGPETYMERRLVKILVDNDWMLRRTVRRLHEAEIAGDNIELMQRYKTTAERSFYRSLNALQQLRKDLMRQDRHAEWWKDRAGKLEKELEKRPPAPAEEPKAKPEEPKAEERRVRRERVSLNQQRFEQTDQEQLGDPQRFRPQEWRDREDCPYLPSFRRGAK